MEVQPQKNHAFSFKPYWGMDEKELFSNIIYYI